ncbi:hypothetical protein K435DRAFT_810313 [Dendrothele bispora CBS 962.96]|uniref:Uncharacterized protein n=1 Tax=Dendrothele bispora (strain CBS 962.96) TaxID=1314807 RepID=A0A4S8KVH7_DENBC|nr:hypothetical protein K435DRAFT_810313 [Dendrothele bispora CBS 962.96]
MLVLQLFNCTLWWVETPIIFRVILKEAHFPGTTNFQWFGFVLSECFFISRVWILSRKNWYMIIPPMSVLALIGLAVIPPLTLSSSRSGFASTESLINKIMIGTLHRGGFNLAFGTTGILMSWLSPKTMLAELAGLPASQGEVTIQQSLIKDELLMDYFSFNHLSSGSALIP